MKGRPPKPTSLKELAGNPGKRARTADEPIPQPATLIAPTYLDGEALEKWEAMSAELKRLGLLTVVDVDALACYCVQYARWRKAESIVKLKGEVIETSNGNMIQNPYLSIANRAQKEMGRLSAEFGFTPASRVRLRAEPQKEDDELEKSLFGEHVLLKKS